MDCTVELKYNIKLWNRLKGEGANIEPLSNTIATCLLENYCEININDKLLKPFREKMAEEIIKSKNIEPIYNNNNNKIIAIANESGVIIRPIYLGFYPSSKYVDQFLDDSISKSVESRPQAGVQVGNIIYYDNKEYEFISDFTVNNLGILNKGKIDYYCRKHLDDGKIIYTKISYGYDNNYGIETVYNKEEKTRQDILFTKSHDGKGQFNGINCQMKSKEPLTKKEYSKVFNEPEESIKDKVVKKLKLIKNN